MPAIESRSEGAWVAAQTGKGTGGAPASAKRLRKVGGDMTVNFEDGQEQYSDGQRFADATDFRNSIIGNGNPVAQGTCDIVAYLAWIILGQETVTGTTVGTATTEPYTHVATPGLGGLWSKWWKKIGATVGPVRQIFNDCRLVSLRIEGSSANKVLKVTPTFLSLDAGEVFTTDPVTIVNPESPMLYTEGTGRFNIDGTIYKAHSAFAIVINDAVAAWWGDDVTPEDITFGAATVDVEGITMLLTAATLPRWLTQVYGTATPAAGAKPIKTIPALGSYTVDLQRGANRQVKIELPGVKWAPPESFAGNPQGGPVEIPLAGQTRAVAGQPMIRVTCKNGDPAYVAS